jgi:hypothetical protein
MKFIKSLPPQDVLKSAISYNPETGILIKSGKETGVLNTTGYLRVWIKGHGYYPAHRIAYALYHGMDPHPLEIDHINRNRSDNRISNLRAVTPSENSKNRDNHIFANTHNPSRRTAVRISYPDGRGDIIVDSVKTASSLLNKNRHRIKKVLNRTDNQLYWGTGASAQPSGIFLSYA